VTRKITRAVAHLKLGIEDRLFLGNLEALRDWGYARDYVRAMWLMLQQDKPDDYVIGTGEMHSVREFIERACEAVDLDWREYVTIDPRYYRPAEVDAFRADYSKARRVLGWEAVVTFRELVTVMVQADLDHVAPALEGGRRALGKTVVGTA
jgi:GDPmannose 4,6-dehydratase